jgi:hypothetical protein
MGVHHYEIALLPRAYFGTDLPATLLAGDEERGEDFSAGWWASSPPSERLLTGLRSLLPVNKTWGETEEYESANQWGSDVRIWKDSGESLENFL